MTATKVKRFYKDVHVLQADGSFQVALDDRVLKTQITKDTLIVKARPLAEAIAHEWRQQDDELDMTAMPITAMVSATIEGGEVHQHTLRTKITEYLKSDLLCYRADQPATLVERQCECWDSYLAYAKKTFGIDLAVTTGIVAVIQADGEIAKAAPLLAEANPFEMHALATITAISGSAVLALCLWKGDFDVESIFAASTIDETFQQERWGVDEEAKERSERAFEDLKRADYFLRLAQ